MVVLAEWYYWFVGKAGKVFDEMPKWDGCGGWGWIDDTFFFTTYTGWLLYLLCIKIKNDEGRKNKDERDEDGGIPVIFLTEEISNTETNKIKQEKHLICLSTQLHSISFLYWLCETLKQWYLYFCRHTHDEFILFVKTSNALELLGFL